jgi:eukaryotic-like serine/threonine-protein kinase
VMLRPELPGLLDAIVMKAMEKTPAARYQSWLDFGKDLSQAFASLRLTGAKASDSEKFTQLRDFAFFADFNDVALWELIRIATWKTIGPQTVLIREGESGDNFYFLVDGEVDVTLFGKLLATVKPGRCFGELLYFAERSQRRTSTITARTSITVMEVKADAMRAATDGCQSAFNKACMRVLIERLIDSNQRLAQAA